MASYSSINNTTKRQKVSGVREIAPTRNSGALVETQEFFPDVGRAEFRPESTAEESTNFKYFNATDKILGRSVEEWIRPAISFHHVVNEFHPHGQQVRKIFDDTVQNILESYKRRIRCVFELGQKLGVKYYTASDVDIAPPGESLEDFHRYLDENVNLILELQEKTGITPLWIKPRFLYHARYNELNEVISKGAQIKKALEVAQKLGAENFLLNEIETPELFSTADFTKNFRQYARLLKLTTEYREHLGYRGQLLLLPNYPTQSGKLFAESSIASNAVAFLKNYNLDRFYKLSVKPGYDFKISLVYNLFGSLEATELNFSPELRDATVLLKTIIDHGGIQPGGLNIGLKSNFKSDLRDVFIGYVQVLDTYAKALKIAAKLISDGVFTNHLQQRYSGFQTGFGSRFMSGEVSLQDLSEQAKRNSGETTVSHGPNFWTTFYSRYTLEI